MYLLYNITRKQTVIYGLMGVFFLGGSTARVLFLWLIKSKDKTLFLSKTKYNINRVVFLDFPLAKGG
jgi:hypothetical protein